MREWYLSSELVGLRGLANSTTGITQKAKRNNWLSRRSKEGTRALEYHISNFHPDVKKQLIEKYVTDESEAAILLGLTGPSNEVISREQLLEYLKHNEGKFKTVVGAMLRDHDEEGLIQSGDEVFRDAEQLKKVYRVIESLSPDNYEKLLEDLELTPLSPEQNKKMHEKLHLLELAITESSEKLSAGNVTELKLKNKNDVSYVTYYDIAASAGAGHLVEYVPSKQIELSEALKIALNIQNPNKSKLLNMEGDSMHPTLKDKSILAIESLDSFKQDGVYVFTFDSTLYVKRLQKGRDGIKVISDNPIYDAWFINRDEVDTDIFTIHGRVTGCAQSV